MTCRAQSPLVDSERANRVRAAISQLRSLAGGTQDLSEYVRETENKPEEEKELVI